MADPRYLAHVRHAVRRHAIGAKRDLLLAALDSPRLRDARLTRSGVLLVGPNGAHAPHLSGRSRDVANTRADLRRIGLV